MLSVLASRAMMASKADRRAACGPAAVGQVVDRRLAEGSRLVVHLHGLDDDLVVHDALDAVEGDPVASSSRQLDLELLGEEPVAGGLHDPAVLEDDQLGPGRGSARRPGRAAARTRALERERGMPHRKRGRGPGHSREGVFTGVFSHVLPPGAGVEWAS